jgi:ubiquinone/menaquinone biosynthesis C-methylase UbiE
MRLWHSLAQQFRQPSGFVGEIAGLLFRMNLEGIEWTINLLEIQPTDHVLEIGFGPGRGIRKVAKIAAQGRVAGVDFSQTMLQQASRRNAATIAAGLVELRLGEANKLPYPDNSFQKAFATNVAYFWNDPVATLHEIRRVMKPGGRMALYIVSKEDIANFKVTQTGLYRLYTGKELAGLLTQAGFHQARFVTLAERLRTGVCALAEK